MIFSRNILARKTRTLRSSLVHRWGHRSWSQFAEDLVAATLLTEGSGLYVDVGAGDPFWGSNTYRLYRRGWTGLLVEPNIHLVNRLRKYRPRDTTIHAAVKLDGRHVDFYESSSWQLSTTLPDRAASLARQFGDTFVQRRVPAIRLETLGLQAQPCDPTFLSIDTEGTDHEVLVTNDWAQFLPRVVCIEELEKTPGLNSPSTTLLQDYGYRLYAHVAASCLFVHKDFRL